MPDPNPRLSSVGPSPVADRLLIVCAHHEIDHSSILSYDESAFLWPMQYTLDGKDGHCSLLKWLGEDSSRLYEQLRRDSYTSK